MSLKPVKKIVVTGGAGQIAYSLLFRIASGEMLGENQPIILHILEVPEAKALLTGLAMELEDCAFPLLKELHLFTDPFEAFEGVNLALLIGAKPRGPGMERKELLSANGKIFIEQGQALNQKAHRGVLVFVVGNPCNTNALIAAKHAPKLDKKQFFAMTRLDQNRAAFALAKKAKVGVDQVKKVAIWGNHSATQVPDFKNAKILGKPVVETISELDWLQKEFVESVQKRGATVIAARGKSSAASAASAIVDSIRSLYQPTPKDDWFSIGTYTAGNPYGIDEDLIFSFPCRLKKEKEIEIISGLEWDNFLKEKITTTEKELIEEREAVANLT